MAKKPFEVTQTGKESAKNLSQELLVARDGRMIAFPPAGN